MVVEYLLQMGADFGIRSKVSPILKFISKDIMRIYNYRRLFVEMNLHNEQYT